MELITTFKKSTEKHGLRLHSGCIQPHSCSTEEIKKFPYKHRPNNQLITLLLQAGILHPMDQGQLAQIRAALALGQAGTGQEANQLRDPGNHDWLPTSSSTEWVPV